MRSSTWRATRGKRTGLATVWSMDVPRGIVLVRGCHSPAVAAILVKQSNPRRSWLRWLFMGMVLGVVHDYDMLRSDLGSERKGESSGR